MTELYSVIRDTNNTVVSRFLSSMNQVRTNPAAIQRLMLAQVRDVLNGEVNIVDATNPYVNLMEACAVNTAGFIIDNESTTRRQYPSVAQNLDDLYLHMSDKDYIDRFAVPTQATFRLLVAKEELLSRLVPDGDTGIKKVVIPRYSTIEVAGHVFTLLYPIEIKQMQHGSMQVVYNADQVQALQPLNTNVVAWSPVIVGGEKIEMLSIDFVAMQLRVATTNTDINQATGYNKTLVFQDEYCYAQVFYKNTQTGNLWQEIKTTHTEQVYDPYTRTAVLQVKEGALGVHIPQVYLTSGMVSGSLRVDIYTTRGQVQLNTTNFKPSAFTSNWAAIDASEKTPFVAAWQAMRSYFVYTTEVISGGAAALGFEALRERVIMNATGPRQTPITGAQRQASLTREGFEVVKYVDTITERIFLATRVLPKPSDTRLVTAGAASIESVVLSFEEALTHSGAIDHGLRLTLTPDILYENVNGWVKMVSETAYTALVALEPERRALAVSERNFLYTPFHYVLDASNDMFETRAYYLDAPTMQAATFVDQNDTTGLQVNTDELSISRVTGGYKAVVKTLSNAAWRGLDDSQVHAQLSFLAPGEDAKCFLNGTLLGRATTGEMLFEFFISTGFDLDVSHRLHLSGFKIINLDERITTCGLNQVFDLVYSASSVMPSGWQSHQMDQQLGRFLLPNRIAGVTQERVSIQFGQALDNLWLSARSIPSSAPHRTYEEDVPAVYTQDVFEIDPVTGGAFSFGADGALNYSTIALRGDPVLNDAGAPVYLHRRGDVMLDANHAPMAIGENYLSRQMDMFFIEGVYHFANDYTSVLYRAEMVGTVVNWITKDLARMSGDLLEQTKVYFYPKVSMGTVKALIEGGNVTQLQAGQSMTARLYVGDAVFENTELRDALTSVTIGVIDAHFKKATVSVSAITAELRQRYGNDVISVSLHGLGGVRSLEVITLLEESERCSIRKKLAALPTGQLIVREDVTVDFVRQSQTV